MIDSEESRLASDAELLETIRQAFSTCPRPLHFTNHTHCCECAEHDQLLLSRDPDTLSIEDAGNAGWDPICFVSPEGFAYYLPALARLALSDPQQHDWYGVQLLFHLCYDGARNARIEACTTEQRRLVVTLLEHIVETRTQLVETYDCFDQLAGVIEYWSA